LLLLLLLRLLVFLVLLDFLLLLLLLCLQPFLLLLPSLLLLLLLRLLALLVLLRFLLLLLLLRLQPFLLLLPALLLLLLLCLLALLVLLRFLLLLLLLRFQPFLLLLLPPVRCCVRSRRGNRRRVVRIYRTSLLAISLLFGLASRTRRRRWSRVIRFGTAIVRRWVRSGIGSLRISRRMIVCAITGPFARSLGILRLSVLRWRVLRLAILRLTILPLAIAPSCFGWLRALLRSLCNSHRSFPSRVCRFNLLCLRARQRFPAIVLDRFLPPFK
jgi:hypothetical protein